MIERKRNFFTKYNKKNLVNHPRRKGDFFTVHVL